MSSAMAESFVSESRQYRCRNTVNSALSSCLHASCFVLDATMSVCQLLLSIVGLCARLAMRCAQQPQCVAWAAVSADDMRAVQGVIQQWTMVPVLLMVEEQKKVKCLLSSIFERELRLQFAQTP